MPYGTLPTEFGCGNLCKRAKMSPTAPCSVSRLGFIKSQLSASTASALSNWLPLVNRLRHAQHFALTSILSLAQSSRSLDAVSTRRDKKRHIGVLSAHAGGSAIGFV